MKAKTRHSKKKAHWTDADKRERIRALHADRHTPREIAAILNAEGHGCYGDPSRKVTPHSVWYYVYRYGMGRKPARKLSTPISLHKS